MVESTVHGAVAAYVLDDEDAMTALEESAAVLANAGDDASVSGAALAYLSRDSPADRAAAAVILGRLAEGTHLPLAKAIAESLLEALETERVDDTRGAVASALGHYWRREDVGIPLELAKATSVNVRYALAKALALTVDEEHEESPELTVLAELAHDDSEEVREWAQFGLTNG